MIWIPAVALVLLASGATANAAGANTGADAAQSAQQQRRDERGMTGDMTRSDGMHQGTTGAPMQGGMPMTQGGMPMMQGGMMGMMNGMNSCGGMMQGSTMPNQMMPQMPAGNEKLQMQMHAEMMQKMGEILAKYAAQLDNKRGAR
jgi:hypothetical protein